MTDEEINTDPEIGEHILCCPHIRREFHGDEGSARVKEGNVLFHETGFPMVNTTTGKTETFHHIIACDPCAESPGKMLKNGNMFRATWGALN